MESEAGNANILLCHSTMARRMGVFAYTYVYLYYG